jgi:hypothetical protein
MKYSTLILLRATLILVALSLSGCTEPDSKATLIDYQQRLSRVLALEPLTVKPTPLPTLPRPAELKQALPELRLDLSAAWASRQCGLDQLIGERNSSLGRVFQPSKQLNYELRLLAKLDYCLQQNVSADLQQQIAHWLSQKQQSVQLAFSNMLLTDDTLLQQWHGSNHRLIVRQNTGLVPSSSALNNLITLHTHINTQQWQAGAATDIEQSLSVLYQHDFLAELQSSLRYAEAWFSQVNPQLLAISPASLCPNGKNTPQLAILSTVFSKFFIKEVQAHLAELRRFYNELWPLISQLYQHTALYPALQQRYQQPAEQLQQQLMLHVTWWQQLNSQCPVGLTPG